MKYRLKARGGRATYSLRKQTVEPVFGIIKSVMDFRQFLLRGLAVWSLGRRASGRNWKKRASR